METKSSTILLCESAKAAAEKMRGVSDEKINEALLLMADALETDTAEILKENEKDIEAARGTISEVMLDRLHLTAEIQTTAVSL